MITNFKIFEENDDIYFSVGDEVICIHGEKRKNYNSTEPKEGKKYLVLKIYEENFDDEGNPFIIDHQYVTEKYKGDWWIDVKDIKHNIILNQCLANDFKSEIILASNKFNL